MNNMVRPCTILFIFDKFVLVMWEEDGKLESGTVERPAGSFNEGEIAMCSFDKDKAGHLKIVKMFKKRDQMDIKI